MKFAGKSLQGRRDYNQDRICHEQEGDAFILAVADGMGGMGGGEVASRLVIQICRERFRAFASSPRPEALQDEIRGIVRLSQERIKEESKDKPELSKMGTTLTIVLGTGDQYVVGNIGDSRTYLISGMEITQLTKDHSFVQEYRDSFLHEDTDAAMLEKISNALTRSLSGGGDEADIYPSQGGRFTLKEGDILMLCSDGLIVDKIGDISGSLLSLISRSDSPETAADVITQWAYTNGSTDNISAVVSSFGEWPSFEAAPAVKIKKTGHGRMKIFAAAVTLLIVLIISFVKLSEDQSPPKAGEEERAALSGPKPVLECLRWEEEGGATLCRDGGDILWKFRVENDSIKGYVVNYSEASNSRIHRDTLWTGATEESIPVRDLKSLEPGIDYEVWVTAFTDRGLILSTERSTVRTGK